MPEKKQVLVICNTAAGQMYLGVLLKRIWYSPVLARTAEEGLRMTRKTSYDLVLFNGDVSQGELQYSVSLLRSDPSIRDAPLVIFMTNDNPIINRTLLSQGCAAILTKPLDLAVVYGVLARLSGLPRSTPRVTVKMQVAIEEGIPEKIMTCINISEGGLYLRTLEPLPRGTILHIRFALPLDSTEVRLAAEVVRNSPLGVQFEVEPGIGLRFADIPDETLLRIRNFVQWEMIGDLEWKSNI